MKKIFTILKIAIAAVLVFILGYGIYALTLFLTYDRLEDNIVLVPEKGAVCDLAETGREYTAVTQNIGFGAYERDFSFFMDGGKESRARSADSVNRSFDKAFEAIDAYNPDFVLMQEVDTDADRSFHIDESALLKNHYSDMDMVFGENYHSAYLFYPIFKPHGKSNSGICTLSKTAITAAIRRQLPVVDSFAKIVDLDRSYTVSRIPVSNGKELVIYNVHLSAYATSGNVKERQIKQLTDEMIAEYAKGNYCIAGGDYNSDFTGDSVPVLNNGLIADYGWCMAFPTEYLSDSLILCKDYTCGYEQPSCRNCDKPYEDGDFTVIVDGFIVTDNVEVTYLENVQTGFEYADHNPVVMNFVLK